MNSYFFANQKGKEYAAPSALAPLADTHTHLFLGKNLSALELIEHAAAAGVGLLGVPVDPVDLQDGHFQFIQNSAVAQEERLQEHEGLQEQPTSHESLVSFLGDTWRGWRQALPQATILFKTFFVCGVHPFGAALFSASIHAQLEEALASPLVRAVGEIGLDYTCDIEPKVQQRVFVTQLKMAQEAHTPVELHIRDARDDASFQAHADALSLLEKYGVPPAGADLHCFTGNKEMLLPYLELGCMVAFGGAATFAKDDAIREAACVCPTDRLLSETDSPFMAPVPLRGTECEPAMVCFVADCLAQVREDAGVATKHETYDALWNNANRFFGFK